RTFQSYSGKLWAKSHDINSKWKEMTWEERRGLVGMGFSAMTDDNKKMGVYVSWVDGQGGRRDKGWHYRIIGHPVDMKGRSPAVFTFADMEKDEPVSGGQWQRHLLKQVTRLASSLPAP